MIKTVTTYTDDELVDVIVRGRSDAFGELYNRYSKKIYNKCLSYTREKELAEDLTHDVFLKLHEKLPQYKNDNFSGWVMRMTFNVCVDHSRLKSRQDDKLSGYVKEEIEYDSEVLISDKELFEVRYECLEEILKQLPKEDSFVLILKYQEDKSIKEIAELYKMGESAIKMKINRAKLKVVTLYEAEYKYKFIEDGESV